MREPHWAAVPRFTTNTQLPDGALEIVAMEGKGHLPGCGACNGELSQRLARAQLVPSRLGQGGESLFGGVPAGGGLLP